MKLFEFNYYLQTKSNYCLPQVARVYGTRRTSALTRLMQYVIENYPECDPIRIKNAGRVTDSRQHELIKITSRK